MVEQDFKEDPKVDLISQRMTSQRVTTIMKRRRNSFNLTKWVANTDTHDSVLEDYLTNVQKGLVDGGLIVKAMRDDKWD